MQNTAGQSPFAFWPTPPATIYPCPICKNQNTYTVDFDLRRCDYCKFSWHAWDGEELIEGEVKTYWRAKENTKEAVRHRMQIHWSRKIF